MKDLVGLSVMSSPYKMYVEAHLSTFRLLEIVNVAIYTMLDRKRVFFNKTDCLINATLFLGIKPSALLPI